MIEIVKPDIYIDFVKRFKYAIAISIILILIGMGVMIANGGPKLGIEFKGGTSIHIAFNKPIKISALRAVIKNAPYFKDASIQEFGSGNKQFLIYTKLSTSSTTKSIENQLKKYLNERFSGEYKILKVEMIGPAIGKEFQKDALFAIFLSFIAILIYITIRFQFRFGIGALLALFHDILMTVGFLCIFGYTFNLDVIAAILTLIGYSVNDTIVIFDRIREKVRTNRKLNNIEAINRGISETLSRTILTAGTVVFVVLALFLFGGHTLKGMSFALLVGTISGTYSSIFIASPVLLMFKGPLMPEKKEKDSVERFKEQVEFDIKNVRR